MADQPTREELLPETLELCARVLAREIGVPYDECVSGPVGAARQVLAMPATAANAHHELVEALEEMVGAVGSLPENILGTVTDPHTGVPSHPYAYELVERARAALAKAKGGAS
jgi:hypothetical protein